MSKKKSSKKPKVLNSDCLSFDKAKLASSNNQLNKQTNLDNEKKHSADSSESIEVIAGRYQLERILGVGGMAIVYRAFDRLAAHLNHPSPYVALKMFKQEFGSFADASYLLYSEYALLASLKHPHIIKAFQFDIDSQTECAFITLELLQGSTLEQWLVENPLGTDFIKIKPMLLEIINAVAHSHEQHIIHGDLKPSNIMLTQQGCTLFDYGLGQMLEGALSKLPKISRKRFDAWTPRYAAPELSEVITPTIKTDIFALSCIIYELISGKNPYYHEKEPRYTVPPERLGQLSKKQWSVLLNGLSIDPVKRTITAVELKEVLSKNKNPFFFWM